jgi:hypothetical protein
MLVVCAITCDCTSGQGQECVIWLCQEGIGVILSLQVQPQCTPADTLSSTGPSSGARPLGGFQPVLPSPDAARQATYERLLRVAAEVFERKSVWSKAQSSLQRLQVRCKTPEQCLPCRHCNRCGAACAEGAKLQQVAAVNMLLIDTSGGTGAQEAAGGDAAGGGRGRAPLRSGHQAAGSDGSAPTDCGAEGAPDCRRGGLPAALTTSRRQHALSWSCAWSQPQWPRTRA